MDASELVISLPSGFWLCQRAGGLGFTALTSPHFNMFKFEFADAQTAVAEAQGNRSLGDFVAARVGEPVPSEIDERFHRAALQRRWQGQRWWQGQARGRGYGGVLHRLR